MKARDIVLEYFPNANDDEIEWILWEETGYPCFWDGEPEESLRKQLQEYKNRIK